MKCPICNQDKNIICSCGFCQDCLNKHGHKGCQEILEGTFEGEEEE
jgi:hypothetical protein